MDSVAQAADNAADAADNFQAVAAGIGVCFAYMCFDSCFAVDNCFDSLSADTLNSAVDMRSAVDILHRDNPAADTLRPGSFAADTYRYSPAAVDILPNNPADNRFADMYLFVFDTVVWE